MNVNLTLTKDYRKNDDFVVRINKPNFQNAQNERKRICYKDYENETTFRPKKTNPNKPNFKRNDGFSAHYTRDCQDLRKTLTL
jgi:hypothetical protein